MTAGLDCTLFAVGDVDGDGFGDLLTINGRRDLAAALTVHGWKASKWTVLAGSIPKDAITMVAADVLPDTPGDEVLVVMPDHVLLMSRKPDGPRFDRKTLPMPANTALNGASVKDNRVFVAATTDDLPSAWLVTPDGLRQTDPPASSPAGSVISEPPTPPAFDPDAMPVLSITGDLNGDHLADAITIYRTSKPHNHHVARVRFALDPASGDADGDGLTDERERDIGSDPADRDTDDDGLLDGWEVTGLPRGAIGPATPLDPLHKDVIVAVALYEGVDPVKAKASIEHAKHLYEQLPTTNPDGTTGIRLHYRFDKPIPKSDQGNWHNVASKHFPATDRGLMHWMMVTGLGGGGQAQQTGDEGSAGANWAAFAHELGHQLGLSHTGDSTPVWCPLYPSLMNYAFNYALGGDSNAIRFSDGRFASVELHEDQLDEHLPFAYDELRYLSANPFRFTLKDDGNGGTLIDWNHNGTFDTEPVSADINYGGSTNAGTRRHSGLVGAGPALALVGDSIVLATLDQRQETVSLHTYLGDEQWSDARPVPKSATNFDPVLIGTPDAGYLLLRRPRGWWISRFTADAIDTPRQLPGIPPIELGGGLLDGHILLVGRRDDDSLPAWLLDATTDEAGKATYAVRPGPEISFTSQVPVDFSVNPATGRLVMVGSMPNPAGKPMCMRVAWFEPGDLTSPIEVRWVGGERGGVACTTRPSVRHTDAGDLFIFHTGTPRDDGQMIAYRTRQVTERDLNDGWLTTKLYDVWTRTRRPIAFEIGPDAEVYAFRWDSGDHAYKVNELLLCHNGLGIDREPMRDHDDAAKISLWGIRHSILTMRRAP